MLTHKLQEYLSNIKNKGLHRQRRALGDNNLFFNKNDYLSLSTHPTLKKAYQRGFERYATGSSGSMVVCGYHPIHRQLERAFADALRIEDALLFSSGYAANVSVMALLARMGTHVLIDKEVHASIYDGIQYSKVSYARYAHQKKPDFMLKLNNVPKNSVVVTESIFSMSGYCAELSEMAYLIRGKSEGLIVDEAHAFGLLGQEGLGAVVLNQLSPKDVPIRVIPLGKAFAGSGAIVAGQGVWIDALLQASRAYIYSTALSPAMTYGLLATLEMVRKVDERRAHLWDLVRYFIASRKLSPLRWRDSNTPIQQLQLGCPKKAEALTTRLERAGIICTPMRQPTVSLKATGLRIILNHQHQYEDIDRLFEVLKN